MLISAMNGSKRKTKTAVHTILGLQSYIKRLVSLTACLALFSFWFIGVSNSKSQASSAYDLINAVNQLREANGLLPYPINGILMSIAQAHSDYQASIGSITHTGSGGTRAKDRALAAGYGGGATFFLSENIAGGSSMDIQRVIQMWQGDDLHLNTMLGPNYQDIGAGISSDGSRTYFTIDVGYIDGSSGGDYTGSNPTTAPANTTQAASPTAIAFYPVLIATPGSDGSVIHEVQPGQALWNIAATYKVDVSDILKLNGLTGNAYIFPGDKLVIIPPSIEPKRTTKPTQKQTAAPSRTPFFQESPPAPNSAAAPTPSQQSGTSSGIDPLIIVISGLTFGGAILIILGNILKRNT